ncbi:MAG: hypothetical protein JRH11_08420, partial [Deltaproteobacteria bacterium]|nr:hypothetical protein [Deltaproteobacteria bacterium]
MGGAVGSFAGCGQVPEEERRAEPVGRIVVAATSGSASDFATGSLIIPMDTTYQDMG